MLKFIDTITGDVLTYEDAEDFRETSKHSFDKSVWNEIDQLADKLNRNEYTGELEAYLGIKSC